MKAMVENWDGNKVAVGVGDVVSFKADMETYGRITGFNGRFLVVEEKNDWGDTRSHLVDPTRAWIE